MHEFVSGKSALRDANVTTSSKQYAQVVQCMYEYLRNFRKNAFIRYSCYSQFRISRISGERQKNSRLAKFEISEITTLIQECATVIRTNVEVLCTYVRSIPTYYVGTLSCI